MITKNYVVHGAVSQPVRSIAEVDGERVEVMRRRIVAELVPVDQDGSGTIKLVIPPTDEAAEILASGSICTITISKKE